MHSQRHKYTGPHAGQNTTKPDIMSKNKEEHKLTPVQGQAAQLLADGTKVIDVAEVVKVNRGTVWSWSKQPSFMAEINRIRNEYRESCQSMMLGLHAEAVATIRRCMNSESDMVALKAALAVIDKAESFQEKEEIPERLDRFTRNRDLMWEIQNL